MQKKMVQGSGFSTSTTQNSTEQYGLPLKIDYCFPLNLGMTWKDINIVGKELMLIMAHCYRANSWTPHPRASNKPSNWKAEPAWVIRLSTS